MAKTLKNRGRLTAMAAGMAIVLLMLTGAHQAQAASYPAGPSTFTGGAEGWKITHGGCEIILVCSSGAKYDATAGNPAGSVAEESQTLINAIGLIKTEMTAESPEFKAVDSGAGSLSLDRQFVAGGLIELTSSSTYTAALVDRTAGTEQKAVTETITAASPFITKQGSVNLIAGHSYAIRIEGSTSATIAKVGLGGAATTRFDNVGVTGPGNNGNGPTDGKNGNNGDDGSNGVTSAQLTTLMQSGGLAGPAVLSGKRIFVKALCPAKVGVACKVSVQGLLKKGKPATSTRSAKIAKGKAKQLVLKVKPAAKSKVAGKGRLLFKLKVKAGSAKTTVYKSLKLIKRK